jgi:hypothetical protein
MAFKPATRTAQHLRIGLAGPTGSGKTYTGIRMGLLLAAAQKGKLAVVDTEDGSASLYQGIESPDGAPWEFDVLELAAGKREPADYTNAIHEAAAAKYPVLLVDSLTHAWQAMLAQVDKAAGGTDKNTYTAWRHVTPQHTRLVEALLSYPGHILFTVRSKMAYELVKNEKGKLEPKKIGLAPVFRDGIEYESTVFLDLDVDHLVTVSKTRIAALDGLALIKPGPELVRPMLAFLTSAAPMAAPVPDVVHTGHHPSFSEAEGKAFAIALGKLNVPYDRLATWLQGESPMAVKMQDALGIVPSRPSQWAKPLRVRLLKMVEKDPGKFILAIESSPASQQGD